MSSALPSAISSNLGRPYDTASNTGTNPRSQADGVWIRDEESRRTSNHRSHGSDSDSDVTTDTRKPPSHASTSPTNGTWNEFKPIEQSYRNRQASATATTNTGFAKQGAYRDNMETRVAHRYHNDKAKKAEAQETHGDSDSDSDDDDDGSEEFEL